MEYDKILEYKEGTSGSLRQGVEQLFGGKQRDTG